MIKFIKKLLVKVGLIECKCPQTPKETVREILTPPAKADTLTTALTAATYIEPAKPVVSQKVRAVTVPATSANTKPKARPVTEGSRRSNVKTTNPATAKPLAPPKPVPGKKKAKRK